MNDENKLGFSEFPAFNIALGKTLIAAAWVDGELNKHELLCLKNHILQFPGITFEDWRKLKIYLAYPICKAEQHTIAEQFSKLVYLSEHRKTAWNLLISVLKADGKINLEERKFAEEMDSTLLENSENFLRKLKFYFFQHTIKEENPWSKESDSRDRFIHEFFDNPVYFLFRKALLEKNINVPHSKPELQKICLYSAILCWFANVDQKISLPELRTIRAILTETCGVSEEVSKCIQEVSFVIDFNDIQLSELVSSLRDCTTKVERNDLFYSLTNLIIVDKEVNEKELECLRTIALYLEVSQYVWVNSLKNVVVGAFEVNDKS